MSTILKLVSVFVLTVPMYVRAQLLHEIEPAFPNLRFTRPVDLQYAGDGSDRLFVVEQEGRILVFPNERETEETSVFLDIRGRVNDSGSEEGLLGLAFHPRFADNGQFFVYYTARGGGSCASGGRCSIVSRFTMDASDADAGDADSETVILEVTQPFSNHNGGQIRFGPDSLLYVGLGDGGSGGDPQEHGQNRMTLLGSLLRIDVDRQESGLAYGIPPGNPFVGTPFRKEIFAYGLRNPWRFSFDRETGDLWLADVGQNQYEEIDLIVSGGNYGWNTMEANDCYSPSSGCDRSGLLLPVFAYRHGTSTGRSVTGGFVYRGSRLERLVGVYVYADFVSGRIWGLSEGEDGTYVNSPVKESGLNVSAFGEDASGELYFLSFDGRIYRFVGGDSTGSGNEQPGGMPDLIRTFPNPMTTTGTIELELARPGNARVNVYDSLGRRVTTIVDTHLDAGRHIIEISGKDLSPGAYYVALRTSEGVTSKKIIVI